MPDDSSNDEEILIDAEIDRELEEETKKKEAHNKAMLMAAL